MTVDGITDRLHVYTRACIGCLAVLTAMMQQGCSDHRFTEDEAKAVIEKVTGCTMPKGAYDVQGFSHYSRGKDIYAAFRVPPAACSSVFEAFHSKGVEAVTARDAYTHFSRGCLLQRDVGVRLFDRALLEALLEDDLQVTGPVRELHFKRLSPEHIWRMIIFDDTGVVYFAAALNHYD